MITDDDADRLIAANPGVQGLAQLGRNAIERVSELERELAAVTAERDAANAYASELNDSLITANAESVALEAERDKLRAKLAAAIAERDQAIAELERAAAEPLFLLTTGAIGSDGEQDDWDIECDSSRRLDAFCAAHPGETVKLYTTPPPAPVAEMREPTDEECERIYGFWVSAEGCCGRTPGQRMGRLMCDAVRAVMGGES